jgi:deazaflavin-dependent oxidoreductase (nitroreductase family)
MTLTHKKPTGILRALLRAPIWLYRYNLGWMMSGRFLLLTHTGRKSGLKRQTVIEVVSHDEATGVYFVAAAWRDESDWYRNIQQNPTVGVQVRNHSFRACAEQISMQEGEARLWDYAKKHPTAFGEVVMVMLGERLPADKETCHKVAKSIPLISLTPQDKNGDQH